MWTHVPDAALMDLVEGSASDRVRAHVAGCASCRARVEDARGGLSWAREASVPEPVPAYWDVQRAQVARAIAGAPAGVGHRRMWTVAALAGAAMLALVTVVPAPHVGAPTARPTASAVLPAWSALPPADEDDSLDVLAGAAEVATAAAPVLECSDVAACVGSLSDEESRALAEALKQQLATGGSL
jgi:hypothetical protein